MSLFVYILFLEVSATKKLHVLSFIQFFFVIVVSVKVTYLKYEIVLLSLLAYISDNKPWILLFSNTFHESEPKLLFLIEKFHSIRT